MEKQMAERKPKTPLERSYLQEIYNEDLLGHYYVVEVLTNNQLNLLFPRQIVWIRHKLEAGKSVRLLLQNVEMGTVYDLTCYVRTVAQNAQLTEVYHVKKKPRMSEDETSGYAILELIESHSNEL
jgi:hypothetical protein